MPAQTANSAAKAREAAAARRRAAAQRSAGHSRPVAVPSAAPAASAQPEMAQAAPVAAYAAPAAPIVVNNVGAQKAQAAMERRRMAAQRSQAQARQRSRPQPSASRSATAAIAQPAVAVQSAAATYDAGFAFDADPVAEEALDVVCELVETNPNALGGDTNSVRAICRNRRQQMASQGKMAVVTPRRLGSRPVARHPRLAVVPQGRDAARQHRVQAARGQSPEAAMSAKRPTGRIRPQRAPEKVVVDETLSGNPVTGTQVSRITSNVVTGGEAGTCRTVTGTEYLGSDHFTTICGTRPEPNKPKVGVTVTGGGLAVTGTEVGRSSKVTGDEHGSCRAVTGTEYLGQEQFATFCENKGLMARSPKVVAGTTAKRQVTVTGSDEFRLRPDVTGNEPGAARAVTGTQYADAGAARLTINGPQKVALTHTIAGREVTGTEVGRSVKVTGDEYGSCRQITGTEYVSTEQFQSFCNTQAVPRSAKVLEDSSRRGQRITGNLVNRSDKVTGNEASGDGKVTGSQYGDSQAPAARAPMKAYPMRTLAGARLTGNRVDHSPKLTGDDRGGCLPVTGTEYYGKDHYAEHCAVVPPPVPAKVHVDVTPQGQTVSGTSVAVADNVTGNEYGAQQEVTGTPYVNPVAEADHHHHHHAHGHLGCSTLNRGWLPADHYHHHHAHGHGYADDGIEFCCEACAADHYAKVEAAKARGMLPPPPVMCNPCADAAVSEARQAAQQAAAGFSIQTPARAALNRITGNACEASGRITGPVNRASGLVSGVPEVRYQNQLANSPQAQVAAETAPAVAARVTGHGSDSIRITGDDWTRNRRVTGTEGPSAQGRNPTMRGIAPMAVVIANARANKAERPEPASVSRITGSSGNSPKGAVITVSGGARG